MGAQAQTKVSPPAKKDSKLSAKDIKSKKSMELSPDVDFAPKNFVIKGKPGSVAQGVILVRNRGENKQTVQFFSEDLFITEKGAAASKGVKGAQALPPVAAENLSISSGTFELEGKAEKKIVVSVKIPKDAKESQFFKFTFRPTSESREKVAKEIKLRGGKGAGLGFYMNVWTVGKVVVEGTEKYDLNVKESKPSYDSKTKQVRFNAQIKNESNVHLPSLSGTAIVLKDNKKLGKIDLSSVEMGASSFMPKTVRGFSGVAPITLGKGTYEIISTFSDPENKVVKVQRNKLEVK